MLCFKGIGNVLKEDQAKRDMLMIRRLKILAQLVGGKEQLCLETDISAVTVGFLAFCLRPRSRALSNFFVTILGHDYL